MLALVETTGAGPEVDRFVSHFLSELSDRAAVRVEDARLSGARFSELASGSGTIASFRQSWPSDFYLALDIQPCQTQPKTVVVHDTRDVTVGGRTVQNSPVDRYVTTYTTECPVSVRLMNAATGRVLSPFSVAGKSASNPENPDDPDISTSRAAEDAATKAAKKLPGALK